MPIDTQIDRAKQLTIFKVKGAVSVSEAQKALISFYEGHPTQNTLWDCREGSLENFWEGAVADSARLSLSLASRFRQARPQGKTAAVTPSDLDFGIASQYVAYAGLSPYEFRVFRQMAQALQWLSGA
ncbi:MAG: hypothetical protein AB1814_16680 [Thermodesulfobacteriota bacterium]